MKLDDDRPVEIFDADAQTRDLVVLVVGNVSAWHAKGRTLPALSEMLFAEVHEINPAFMSEMAPDIVLSSIITPDFDAIDLAIMLCEAGFTGRYRALTPRLPNPGLVRREVHAACPALDFDVLIVDQESNLHRH